MNSDIDKRLQDAGFAKVLQKGRAGKYGSSFVSVRSCGVAITLYVGAIIADAAELSIGDGVDFFISENELAIVKGGCTCRVSKSGSRGKSIAATRICRDLGLKPSDSMPARVEGGVIYATLPEKPQIGGVTK